MEKYTADDLRAFVDTHSGAYPDRLTAEALREAGFDQLVALLPLDHDARIRHFGNVLVQMICNRKSRAEPLDVELHTIATALSYLLNSTSFAEGKYHPFDKSEISRKLRRQRPEAP